MSFDGFDEQEFILSPAGIGSLLGGRVWEAQVPPNVKLREEKGEIPPYAIVTFGSPIAFAPGGRSDRTFGASQQEQSHLMSIQVHVHATTAETLRSASLAVLRKLIGMVPNPDGRSCEISAQGGPIAYERDNDGKVARLIRVIHAQLVVS